MSQSEQINELATALSKAQGEMQAAIKDKINPFYKSAYADLGSVWDAARPVLSKHGLCVMQTTELMPDKNQIVMVTTLAHTSGQWIKSYLPLMPAKLDSQGVGASMTYLRRYSLSALVGVVCDVDDDGETDAGRGKAQGKAYAQGQASQHVQIEIPASEKIGQAEIVSLTNLLDNLSPEQGKGFREWIRKNFNAPTIQDIPRECYGKIMYSLQQTKIKAPQQEQRAIA